ncbi:MAG: zf-HC2 domain-containing protein [Anaerolineaceae bacterium]|nr:zf-HC2 domain-containing protein [Anaerolineaceae bacterium]
MKCQELMEQLTAYLDGEVAFSERTLIQAHLTKCNLCQEELAALSKTQNRISQTLHVRAAQAVPSPQAWNHLQVRLAREARPSLSWLQRLAASGWQLPQMNSLTMKGRKKMKGKMKMNRKSVLIALALVALVSVGFIAYHPPTHALALEILARFESVIITNAPTNVESVQNPTPTSVGQPTSTPMSTPLRVLTIEEANEEAGFEILSPTYLPAGYQLIGRGAHHAEAVVSVGTTYAMVGTTYDPTYGLEDGTPTIRLIQNQYVSEFTGEFSVGDAPSTQVEVRGQTGLWIEQAEVGCCDEDRNVILANLLIWEEGDFLVDLRSDDLPLEEMLRIAESLSP